MLQKNFHNKVSSHIFHLISLPFSFLLWSKHVRSTLVTTLKYTLQYSMVLESPCYILDPQNLVILCLCPSTNTSQAPSPLKQQTFLQAFGIFRFRIQVRSYSICLSLSEVSHLAYALKLHPCCYKWKDFLLSHG